MRYFGLGLLQVGDFLQKVGQLAFLNVLDRCVVYIDDCVGEVGLEALYAHDFLLEGVLGDKSIDVQDILLPQSVSAVDSLHIDSRVVVVVEHNDDVGRGEVEAIAAHHGGDQQHFDVGIIIEFLGYCKSLVVADGSRELEVINLREYLLNK